MGFFSPVLPFLVGQQMELPTRLYLSLQSQLLQNAGARVAVTPVLWRSLLL